MLDHEEVGMARKTIKRTREKKTFLLEVGVEYPPDGLRPVMAKYLEWLAVKGYSETTLTHLENGLILFARWCEDRGLKRPQEVTRAVLELFQRHLFYYRRPNGLPLTARTQGARLSALKGSSSGRRGRTTSRPTRPVSWTCRGPRSGCRRWCSPRPRRSACWPCRT
jgi:hypothetical protein